LGVLSRSEKVARSPYAKSQ